MITLIAWGIGAIIAGCFFAYMAIADAIVARRIRKARK